MSAPLLPTSRLVAEAWLRLAVPGVGVGAKLPKVTEVPALRTAGFIRTALAGGNPDRDVPMRAPVIAAECWFAPHEDTGATQWTRAEQLGERVVAATYDRDLMDVLLDLTPAGNYAPARVKTVIALTEPDRVETDQGDFARADVDLLITWTAA